MFRIMKESNIRRLNKMARWISIGVLLLYVVIMLRLTIFDRNKSLYPDVNLKLFWSYAEFINGDWNTGKEILINILMFAPVGFLLIAVADLYHFNKKRIFPQLIILTIGILLSLSIEGGQYFNRTGLVEIDDVIDNCLGTGVGILTFILFKRICQWIGNKLCQLEREQNWIYIILLMLAISIILMAGIVAYYNLSDPIQDEYPKEFAFQIDQVDIEQGVTLTGFSILYGNEAGKIPFQLYLKSLDDRQEKELKVESGLKRTDINQYYACEYDYTYCGFKASDTKWKIDDDQVFEIYIKWKGFAEVTTGVFLKENQIWYVDPRSCTLPDVEGTDLEEVVDKGYLLAFKKEYACYIYQYERKLYWIIGPEYKVPINLGIPYFLWTTQMNKFPQSTLDLGLERESIGTKFVNYEITNTLNCGKYRVNARDIPTTYSVTAIRTGYFLYGKMIWSVLFRPIFVD